MYFSTNDHFETGTATSFRRRKDIVHGGLKRELVT
jgi:hypothetical protein